MLYMLYMLYIFLTMFFFHAMIYFLLVMQIMQVEALCMGNACSYCLVCTYRLRRPVHTMHTMQVEALVELLLASIVKFVIIAAHWQCTQCK